MESTGWQNKGEVEIGMANGHFTDWYRRCLAGLSMERLKGLARCCTVSQGVFRCCAAWFGLDNGQGEQVLGSQRKGHAGCSKARPKGAKLFGFQRRGFQGLRMDGLGQRERWGGALSGRHCTGRLRRGIEPQKTFCKTPKKYSAKRSKNIRHGSKFKYPMDKAYLEPG